MRIAVFSTKPYDATYLQQASAGQHDLAFFEALSQTFALPDFQLMLQSSSREMSM